VPKSKIESTAHYAPEPAQGSSKCGNAKLSADVERRVQSEWVSEWTCIAHNRWEHPMCWVHLYRANKYVWSRRLKQSVMLVGSRHMYKALLTAVFRSLTCGWHQNWLLKASTDDVCNQRPRNRCKKYVLAVFKVTLQYSSSNVMKLVTEEKRKDNSRHTDYNQFF